MILKIYMFSVFGPLKFQTSVLSPKVSKMNVFSLKNKKKTAFDLFMSNEVMKC